METSYTLLQRGHYLAALAQEERAYQAANKEERSRIGQNLATLYSFCGDEARAEDTFPHYPNTGAALPSGGTLIDARRRILQETRQRQLVMLNEAHYKPRHRAFGLSLLADLKRQGFTHFAAEAFAPGFRRGPITGDSGYYLHDPVFAAYAREALRLGFQVVAYEAENREAPSDKVEDSINFRELQQAKNLQQKIFKTQPGARVLIHVGYDHLIKEPVKLDSEVLWLGGQLKQLLKIEPLTIDQIQGDGRLSEIRRSSLLRQPDGSSGASGNLRRADLYVFHPKATYRDGRPDWLFTLPGRRRVPVPDSFLPSSGRVLIQAFREGEPADAIAWDRVLITAGQSAPVLALPSGSYRMEQQTESELTARVHKQRVS